MKIISANILLVFIILNLNGCAKKVLMKYAEPSAIKECEENFYDRYYMFINTKEKEKLGEIKTLTECGNFLNDFWGIRDTDPTTIENEFKILIEKRAENIDKENLFQNSNTQGFSFKNHGGFFGDPAKVYMLHGMPNYIETLKNGIYYVDLMLWVYWDEQGNHRYRFLFYNKNNNAIYVLLRPNFDMLYGIQEINKNPTFINPTEVYYELEQNGKFIFLLSLVYFSDDSSLNVDKALRPPKPASQIAKELAPKIIGDLPKKENIVISNNFSSFIPAEFSYEMAGTNLILKIAIRHENLDWILKDNQLTAELFVKVVVWSANKIDKEERMFDIVSTEKKVAEKKSIFIFESIPIDLIAQSTRVSVYIKNNNKYNAWIEEIQK